MGKAAEQLCGKRLVKMASISLTAKHAKYANCGVPFPVFAYLGYFAVSFRLVLAIQVGVSDFIRVWAFKGVSHRALVSVVG